MKKKISVVVIIAILMVGGVVFAATAHSKFADMKSLHQLNSKIRGI